MYTAAPEVNEWLAAGRDHSPFNGKPITPPVPETVGERGLAGETETVNVVRAFRELQTPVSRERTSELLKGLAWAWNFHLPDIVLFYRRFGVWGNTEKYAWPDDRAVLTTDDGGRYALKTGRVSKRESPR